MKRLADTLSIVIIGASGLAAAAGCSGHASAKARDAAIDAPRIVDAAPKPDAFPDASFGAQTVVEVDCSSVTPDATVFASDGNNTNYIPPATTIQVGQVIQFQMPITHNVAPGPGPSDIGLNVSFMQTSCLKFTATGTFGFHCTTHTFSGTVTVTAAGSGS